MCAIKNLCETTGIVYESVNDAVNINGERIRCKFSYI